MNKVKKIGNSLVMIGMLLYTVFVQADSIVLQSVDSNGALLQQAARGVPFFLEVITATGESYDQKPTIEGLSIFNLEDQGLASTIISTINGVRSVKKVYRFMVRADKEGSYTVGPAMIKTNKGTLSSKPLTVIVSQQQATNDQATMIRMYVDQQKVYVGQKVAFVLRFYPQEGAQLLGITQPILQDFVHEDLEGPVTGTEQKEGKSLTYLEWHTDIYPQKTGVMSIPALKTTYQVPRKNSAHNLNFFMPFFDSGFEQQQQYSNSLSLEVMPLPEGNDKVTALGQFSKVVADVDHDTAVPGEAIVYRLHVYGSGNLPMIQHPVLQLPDGLKYYESKQSISEDNTQKVFEYIIQGSKPGSFVIPQQQFFYFDPAKQRTSTLTSNAVSITIKGTEAPQESKPARPTEPKKELPTFVDQTPSQEDILFIEDGALHKLPERSLPWPLFFVLLSLIIVSISGHSFISAHIQGYRQHRKKLSVFKAARKKIDAWQSGSTPTLYDIVLESISIRTGLSKQALTAEKLTALLKEKNSSDLMLSQWHTFYQALLESAYGITSTHTQDALKKMSKEWVDRLGALL